MQTVFDSILNMSITASIVILVVVLARFLLKGLPKKYSYALWSIVAFRLCCPFSFKSVISIFNINPIQNPSEVVTNSGSMNYIDAPFYIVNPLPNGVTMNGYVIGGADAPMTTIVEHHFTDYLPYIWLVGLVTLLIYGFSNYFIIRSKLLTATKKESNVYQSEKITSPFILGIIKPKIYVPYSIDEEYYDYVIAHEKHHLKRCDNVIKFVAFLLLCVHWFNPLGWVAFYLMSKDMEMSCDEWVLAHNEGIKKTYSNALLSFAVGKNFPKPSPLCFGEGSAKSRIKNILKYKKPAVIASVIAFILCVAIAIVCIANPKSELESINNSITNNKVNTSNNANDNIDFIYDNYWYSMINDGYETNVCCTQFTKDGEMKTTVYVLSDNEWTSREENLPYYFDENDTIVYDWASGIYSKAFIQYDTEKQTLAEYDRNTMNDDKSMQKVLVQYIPQEENSLEIAKLIYNVYSKATLLGDVKYLDKKQSMNPNEKMSVMITQKDIFVIDENNNVFDGVYSHSVSYDSEEFRHFLSENQLKPIEPYYSLPFSTIDVSYHYDRYDQSKTVKYALIAMDDGYYYLGFVNSSGQVWCIRDINVASTTNGYENAKR